VNFIGGILQLFAKRQPTACWSNEVMLMRIYP
jgi:hypothetical protein